MNSWRTNMLWVSGHGEGWALYAERLMEELGYLKDPGDRMGMLNAQRMRAARVVFDIGVHCEMPIPAEWAEQLGVEPGTIWTSELGYEFLKLNLDESRVTCVSSSCVTWVGRVRHRATRLASASGWSYAIRLCAAAMTFARSTRVRFCSVRWVWILCAAL